MRQYLVLLIFILLLVACGKPFVSQIHQADETAVTTITDVDFTATPLSLENRWKRYYHPTANYSIDVPPEAFIITDDNETAKYPMQTIMFSTSTPNKAIWAINIHTFSNEKELPIGAFISDPKLGLSPQHACLETFQKPFQSSTLTSETFDIAGMHPAIFIPANSKIYVLGLSWDIRNNDDDCPSSEARDRFYEIAVTFSTR